MLGFRVHADRAPAGAAQRILPPSKRKKTIGIKEIEATIATMARIPPKTVSKDDAEVLRHLEETLRRVREIARSGRREAMNTVYMLNVDNTLAGVMSL